MNSYGVTIEPKAIRVKRLHPDAKLPTRANATDAGLDLYAHSIEWNANTSCIVKTGIAIEIPAGYVGIIKDRSSLAAKGWHIAGGVIDAGYTGGLVIVFHANTLASAFFCGEKIAQLLIVPCLTPAVVEVDELAQSERGSNGFGSSGV